MAGFAGIWEKIKGTIEKDRRFPSAITIPDDHVMPRGDGVFVSDEHYFQVRINEMFLTKERKWLTVIDPMVFIVSEFIYNDKEQVVPAVVGRDMMKGKIDMVPQGMIFKDTRVAGLHPYRGGRLTLSVVLCQVQVGNVASPILQLVGNAANALNFSMSLTPYAQVASVVVSGFEALLGLQGTVPLVGLSKPFDPDAGDELAPHYYALIDKPGVEAQMLWVQNSQLLAGTSLASAQPYREGDYVLYSIVKDPNNERSDVRVLPFFEQWQRVLSESMRPGDESWESARANMLALYQTLKLSPDLISAQADKLADFYLSEMKKAHDRAVNISRRGVRPRAEAGNKEMDAIRGKSVSILNM